MRCSSLLTTAALAVALALGASAPAHAQTKEDKALAKAQFAEGQRAFKRDDFDEALRHFRRAFELHSHDAVRFNIAVCLERLHRFREALAEYEAAAKSEQLSDKERKRAATKVDAVRAELGTLEVKGSPEGAEVLVEGEALCKLPCSVPADPRELSVIVRSGASEQKHTVQVRRQQTAVLEVTLDPQPATGSAPAAAGPPAERDPGPRAPSDTGATRGPGFLTWTGAGLMVVGGAGIAVFGPKAQSEHDEFVNTGSPDAKSSGEQARNLTNVAIGVAAVGAVVLVVDLFVLAKQPETTARRRAGVIEF